MIQNIYEGYGPEINKKIKLREREMSKKLSALWARFRLLLAFMRA
jgi:hypothetical protein